MKGNIGVHMQISGLFSWKDKYFILRAGFRHEAILPHRVGGNVVLNTH